MISFDEALAIIGSAAQPLGTEWVALDDAAGRVLAQAVMAAMDSPRADVSAMDGYAVRGEDLAALPVALNVIGESFPGAGWPGTVERGNCVRIFTGAPLPDGADRIVIQERVRREANRAIIDKEPGPPSWVRWRGKDFSCGDEVLPAARLLDPAALVAAAGADVAELQVFVKPRITLIATGNELVEPGAARSSILGVPDSASFGVAALARQWGARIVDRRRLPDDLGQLRTAAERSIHAADVVVVIGGASVGKRDFAKAMFETLGLELLFSKISIRPGKPAWLGRVGGTLVLGLPGNPTSALVTARLLLAPLLAGMQGRPADVALRWEPAILATPVPACDRRETFHRARLAGGKASLITFQDSHAQKALAEADVLLRQAANSGAVPPEGTIEILRF